MTKHFLDRTQVPHVSPVLYRLSRWDLVIEVSQYMMSFSTNASVYRLHRVGWCFHRKN